MSYIPILSFNSLLIVAINISFHKPTPKQHFTIFYFVFCFICFELFFVFCFYFCIVLFVYMFGFLFFSRILLILNNWSLNFTDRTQKKCTHVRIIICSFACIHKKNMTGTCTKCMILCTLIYFCLESFKHQFKINLLISGLQVWCTV